MSIQAAAELAALVRSAVREEIAALRGMAIFGPANLKYGEAAKRLGIGVTKLKRMIKAGDLRTKLVGGKRMVPASEIERLSTPDEQQSKKPRAQPTRKERPNQHPKGVEAMLRERRGKVVRH